MATIDVARPMAEPPEGIEVDPDAKRLTVLGVDVIVGWAMCWVTTDDGLVNLTILCGENGWWVDLAMHVGFEDAGTMYATPADWRYGDPEAIDAEGLADMIAEVSCRTRPFPPWMDEYDRDPFCGCEPGTWASFDAWDWPRGAQSSSSNTDAEASESDGS